MPETLERKLIIPKANLIAVPPGIDMRDWLNFAVAIHANNLGLQGFKVDGISVIEDRGAYFVVGFECIDMEDAIRESEEKEKIQILASEDIKGSLDKYKID